MTFFSVSVERVVSVHGAREQTNEYLQHANIFYVIQTQILLIVFRLCIGFIFSSDRHEWFTLPS